MLRAMGGKIEMDNITLNDGGENHRRIIVEEAIHGTNIGGSIYSQINVMKFRYLRCWQGLQKVPTESRGAQELKVKESNP